MKIKQILLPLIGLGVLVGLLTGCGAPPSGQAKAAQPGPTIARLGSNSTPGFILSSPAVVEGGALPTEYTCDGDSATLPLTWNGAPAGTKSFAVIMHHVPGLGDAHWYWVVYNIPANVTSLPKNSAGIGTLGNNSVNGRTEYAPPCSKGPGPKLYTYTVYALSAQPQLSAPAAQVSRDMLLKAIQDITLASAELNVTYTRQEDGGQGRPPAGGPPPQAAIAACTGKSEQDACEFTSHKGTETGLCETVQGQLACSPPHGPAGGRQPGGDQPGDQPGQSREMNIEQAISDEAQRNTIAFDALAFLTGDLGADSFFPPGKVADFWGFQYLRDNDPSQMGHNTDFLTRASLNVLTVLTPAQRAELIALAKSQVDDINQYAANRFVLMQAFRRLLAGDLPVGSTGLNEAAVKAYSAQLYRLDGEISYERAQVMGTMIAAFTPDQRAYLDGMVGKGMLDWPDVGEPGELRGLERDVKVAVMTYAGDMFSWYAGSVEADVYFCPERQGTYFGSFYLKDAPAVGNRGYTIASNLTGDMGRTLLETLPPDQAQLIAGLVDLQRPYLLGIVDIRGEVATALRQFMSGGTPDRATVLNLMEKYGELDGAIVYNFALNFAQVNQSLTEEQKAQLTALRSKMLGDMAYPSGAYLYSQPIAMPQIPNSDFLFN